MLHRKVARSFAGVLESQVHEVVLYLPELFKSRFPFLAE
jgi:hypothetical protein